MRKIFFIFLILSSAQLATAQLEFAKGFGGQIGISYNLGTHFNRLGIMVKLYYHYEYIQANVQLAGYYNFRALAIEKPSWEGQAKIGLVGIFGPKSTNPNPFVHEISNQTGRAYSIGYSYNFYFDNLQTSQMTGTFGFGIYDFRLSVENDFMAAGNHDRYRTGAMTMAYRINNTQILLQHAAWTGDPYAEGTSEIVDEENFPAKYGYREMANAPYSRYSVGSISLGVEQAIGYGQYLGVSIGIDADQIRNLMQNELIHENKLLKNPHIPMLDTEGNQYLYEEGQKVRAPKFFLQFLGNSGNFF